MTAGTTFDWWITTIGMIFTATLLNPVLLGLIASLYALHYVFNVLAAPNYHYLNDDVRAFWVVALIYINWGMFMFTVGPGIITLQTRVNDHWAYVSENFLTLYPDARAVTFPDGRVIYARQIE